MNDIERINLLERVVFQMTDVQIPEKQAKKIAQKVAREALALMRGRVRDLERDSRGGQ